MSHKLVSLYIGDGEYYTRTDADTVIAEKDKEIDELRNEADVYKAKYEQEYDIAVHNEKQLSAMRIELRHQNYKRCLGLAAVCSSNRFAWSFIPEDDEVHKSDFYKKWHRRWLELAEKFKPNN